MSSPSGELLRFVGELRAAQVPVSVAEAAAASCRHSHLVVLPGVGHFVPRDRPAALVDALNRLRP